MKGGRLMQFDSKKQKGSMVVTISGRMDAVTTGEIESKLASLIDGGERNFVLDLGALEYISSAGLRTLLATAKRLKAEKGTIVFANLAGHVTEVFKISGSYSLFTICDSVEAAFEKLGNVG
jgi:stage II sporulation protein AA (anti-sigma F factor antagonist)